MCFAQKNRRSKGNGFHSVLFLFLFSLDLYIVCSFFMLFPFSSLVILGIHGTSLRRAGKGRWYRVDRHEKQDLLFYMSRYWGSKETP